jgi:2-phosphosulfolactate phosphatase
LTVLQPLGERARHVLIDAFPESVSRYRDDHAIVAVDVIRATTMAVTAVASGRRCLIAESLPGALAIRQRLPRALLAGELAGEIPELFEMNNSPTALAARNDVERPLVMLSSSGTRLMTEASRSSVGGYVACLRNFVPVARHLIAHHDRVAVIGAGSRGTFREEDQLACAWIAELLMNAGYEAANPQTTALVDRWTGAPVGAVAISPSVEYLRRSGQLEDLDFVVDRVSDLEIVCAMAGNEVAAV